MAGIRLENVTKSFDAIHETLRSTSFEIDPGEFLVLIGPSGCGKTTLLRLIAGLEEVSSGKIFIDRKEVTQVEPKNRGVAMVFQNYALYPHMTVYENLSYPLKVAGFSKNEQKLQCEKVARILRIEPFMTKKPNQLSGGQKQRVAIGRALVREPKVFLFDEPLSNLDARLREEMRVEIAHLHARLQRSTIYVTHDQHDAMTLGDRLLVMKDGQIQQSGAPLELYENPVNLFTASFLGAPPLNTLSGKFEKEGFFQSNEAQFKISKPNCYHLLHNTNLTLGIRPESIKFKNSEEGQKSFSAVVKRAEHLGSETYYYLESGINELIMKSYDAKIPLGKHDFFLQENTLLWFDEAEKRIGKV